METFSVWNYGTRKYDYYAAGQYKGTHVTQPENHAMLGSRLGQTPDEFAASVPVGASKVGSGDVAKGQVASFGEKGSVRQWLLYGVFAYIAWRMFR